MLQIYSSLLYTVLFLKYEYSLLSSLASSAQLFAFPAQLLERAEQGTQRAEHRKSKN